MMNNKEYLGNEGYALMGAAFEVYKEMGYLINFGTQKTVEWKRYILQDYVPKSKT